jgi:uncharacterized SAM-binding protein YcdF (DUF218 family)
MLVHFLHNPIIVLWLLILAAIALRYFNKKKPSMLMLWGAAMWLFIISWSPIPRWMMTHLEGKYPVLKELVPSESEQNTHILVLGGGHTFDPELRPCHILSLPSWRRLAEGIYWYRQLPGAKLITSGYSLTGRTTQAAYLADCALDYGVAVSDTIQLGSGHNTKSEAYSYLKRFGTKTRLILITSAAHMPRAVKHFRKAGLSPIPAPCDYQVKTDTITQWKRVLPSYHKVLWFDKAVHEYLGLIE